MDFSTPEPFVNPLLCNERQLGLTALLSAVNTMHSEIVHALVKAGADVEVERGRAERVRAVQGCGLLLCVGWQFAPLFPILRACLPFAPRV
jgi:hypothetical protein